MSRLTILQFIGPKDNYNGRFGIEFNGQDGGWTIHILPRNIFWGVDNHEDTDWKLTTYGIGPFASITMAEYKDE